MSNIHKICETTGIIITKGDVAIAKKYDIQLEDRKK